MNDKEIEDVMKELGLSVSRPPQAQEKFHIVTTPPQGFPVVDIIRLTDKSRFYLITMGVAIHPVHKKAIGGLKLEERKEFLNNLAEDLLKMGVDFAFLPPGTDVPDAIQIIRIIFADGMTPNELLSAYYVVRNAGMLVINRINNKFGVADEGKQGITRYV
ncbi:hypothetical protein SUSAZ_07805 [Sulfolobus acidocaldarius SUSAZ]|nr:hypothetical protein SUSAZ_07805 [Sulfolobus acidocaldarius SUSAZ]